MEKLFGELSIGEEASARLLAAFEKEKAAAVAAAVKEKEQEKVAAVEDAVAAAVKEKEQEKEAARELGKLEGIRWGCLQQALLLISERHMYSRLRGSRCRDEFKISAAVG